MGLTDPIAECLQSPGDADATQTEIFTSFYDPIVEGMLVSVSPVLDICCIIIEADADLLLTVPDLVASLALDLGEWVLNPLLLIELAGVDLPAPLNGLDMDGLAFDIEYALPAVNCAIGLLLIPLNIMLDWLEGLAELELPSIPTLGDLEILLEPLGYDLPEGKLGECIAQIPMIPLQAVGDIIEGDTSVCD